MGFLQVYYTEYLKPVKTTDDSCEMYNEEEVQVSAGIVRSLMVSKLHTTYN